jgi:predicted esterase
MGMRMPGWYDISQFGDLNGGQDETGILRSRTYFHDLIKKEIDGGIPSDRIVIGGFSQGGAMSVFSGITCPTRLGGIFGLSCYLLLHNKVKDMIPTENPNKNTPLFLAHGAQDQTVRLKWAELSVERLKQWGWNVNFKVYPYVAMHVMIKVKKSLMLENRYLAHSAEPQEIDDLEAYIKERIPPLGDKAPGL